MRLAELRVRNFRNLEEISVEPSQGLNLVVGPNGAGKTALLESIFFLARGKSFRTNGSRPLVREGARGMSVFGKVVGAQGEAHRVGIGLEGRERRVRVDGVDVGRLSALAEALGVSLLVPQSHEILDRGPDVRRRLVDWGVFHVEPVFREEARRYVRALHQRNAALRDQGADVHAWDELVAETGEAVQFRRENLVAAMKEELRRLGQAMLKAPVEMVLKRGWPESVGSLKEALKRSRRQDFAQGFTGVGPHRAEVRVLVDGRPASEFASRGQQKLVVASILIAMSKVVKETRRESMIFLLDDFPSELDVSSRGKLWEEVARLGCQCFVSGLDLGTLPKHPDSRMFHVERGNLVSPSTDSASGSMYNGGPCQGA